MGFRPLDGAEAELFEAGEDTFPFRTHLSLCQLVAFWESEEASENPVRASMARVIREQLRQASGLCSPETAPAVLRRHRPLIDASSFLP